MQRTKEIHIFLLKYIGVKIPGRDEEWKKETIKNTSVQQFQTEFECEFLGSINTLISSQKLKVLPYREPIQSNAGLDVHIAPQERKLIFLLLMFHEEHHKITQHF